MAEQTAQGTSSPEWDASADGVAYRVEEDTTSSQPTPEPADESLSNPLEGLAPDGVGLDEDGEVSFGDDFFGDMRDEPMPKEAPTPKYYTEDELRATPYEKWELERLNGDVQKYAPIVREQLQQREMQATIRNAPVPEFMAEPKQYTPKELAEAARTRAVEMLGLEDPEDFDDYEGEHRAAMDMAIQELLQQRNTELGDYRRGQEEWGQLQQFNAELAARPDFNDFNEWYIGKLKERGVTAEQVNAGLYDYALKNGNRFSLIPQVIVNWYREYQQERGMTRRTMPSKGRVKAPSVLEGTSGGNYDGRRRVDMRSFGEMDDDAQAQALINLGIV